MYAMNAGSPHVKSQIMFYVFLTGQEILSNQKVDAVSNAQVIRIFSLIPPKTANFAEIGVDKGITLVYPFYKQRCVTENTAKMLV
jgi:hypothetical protein